MTMKGRVTTLAAAVAVIGAFAVPSAGAAVGARVNASNYMFTSDSVTIHKGDKVVWKFVDGKHDVKGKGFRSPVQRDGKFSHKCTGVGTFQYHCTIHAPDMKGVVKVVK